MEVMSESRDEDRSPNDSPPSLSSLSLKAPKKSLGLQLAPTLTTSPASPQREYDSQAGTSPKSPAKSLKSPKSPKSPTEISKASPLRSPPKLATLSKPPGFALSSFRGRTSARHSIDVRNMPSYLAKKRQSTFGQFLSVLNPTANEDSETDEPLFEEPIAPTLSLGERVAWVKTSGPEFGTVRWIGRMPQISNDWTVGVEFDNCIGSGDGTVEGRRYLVAKENFAKFLPLSALTKVDNYAGRPRSGTMLSRMSVQLKPGQLISIQRSPSVVIPHCSLNAPHHVGHDVHTTNQKHCQCSSCNHPCAHICKTSKPKGRTRVDDFIGKPGLAHMCHFSSKPHAKMCCGGEDLPCATKPLTAPGTSWLPIHDMASFRTVPTEPIFRRKSVTIDDKRNAISAPTSVTPNESSGHDRKPSPSPNRTESKLRERSGSDLSISSLPSSGSPRIYYRRGVLTDESDFDSDTERSHSPRFSALSSMSGLKSFIACFHNSSSLREKKKLKDKRRRKLRKQKKRAKLNFVDNKRGHRRGLSTDSSYSCESTHSQNQTSSIVSNISSSKVRTNVSPNINDQKSVSPKHTTAEPHKDMNAAKEEVKDDNVGNETNADKDRAETSEERRRRLDGEPISEGNEGQDGCTSSSKSSGHLITTKADIESTVNHRSSSSHSTFSELSPRRRSKKSVPAPPPPPTSTSPTSLNNMSISSTSLPQTPTHSSTPGSVARRRSYKKQPAPTPPNLTRSLSEQKQLNMKNVINAVPSFRSEIDLQGESRRSSPFSDSIERDDISFNCIDNQLNHKEVPLSQTDTTQTEGVGTSDASTQVTFVIIMSDYYEDSLNAK